MINIPPTTTANTNPTTTNNNNNTNTNSVSKSNKSRNSQQTVNSTSPLSSLNNLNNSHGSSCSLTRNSSVSSLDSIYSTPANSCNNNHYPGLANNSYNAVEPLRLSINGFVENRASSLTSIAKITYFFDDGRGGGFLSIPHLGRHGSACTAGIARLLERWLSERIANSHIIDGTTSSLVPILEEPIENVTESISLKLKTEGQRYLSTLEKVLIEVNAGHIYCLKNSGCDDINVINAATQFGQDYPLFLDLTIKAQSSPYNIPCYSTSSLLLNKNKKIPNRTTTSLSETSLNTSTSYLRTYFGKNNFATEIILCCNKTLTVSSPLDENKDMMEN